MPAQLYPAALIEDGLEAHLARHAGGGHAIYLTVVAALIAAGAALPTVRVRISVRSAGIIRPVTEKQAIRARISGLVEHVLAAENQQVHEGDTIARFQTSAVDDRAALLAKQLVHKERLAGDLERLARADVGARSSAPRLETADYRREYAQLAGELRENGIALDRAVRSLARVRALRAGHFATATDLEEAQGTVAEARAERALIVERYRNRWQGALTALRAEIAQLASQRSQVDAERALYTVVAPISGTLERVASLSPGSYVQAGEELAVVSPSAELVAEVYVSPRDIGLLRPGTPVRVLVDAFDYRQWGVVSGSVRAISGDFVQVDGRPMFRVACTLADRRLALPNGAVGELRKGMTLQAHFVVAERTLLQLITDDVSDWLDPSRAPAVGGERAP